MWKTKIILILTLSWLALSLAKSVPPSSLEDYDYQDEITIRMFPKLYRGKSDEDSSASRPIQKYWQNLVRNIPPFRWNMTNSLGNLFNAGAQGLIETPVGNHQDVDRKRRRKSTKIRKSSVKKSKSRRKSNSRGHSDIYNYATASSPYSQLQLQPLGMDERNIMHFYEPRSGQYYALHLVSSPNYYNQQQYYSPQNSNYDTETKDNDNNDDDDDDDDGDDDSYYGEHHEHGHGGHHDHDDNEEDEEHDDHSSSADSEYQQNHPNYLNEYNKVAESAAESGDDYADDVQVADNWGYTDDDIFGERKLKFSLKPIHFHTKEGDESSSNNGLMPSIIKLEKNLLKPETEEDVMLFLAKNKKRNQRKYKRPSRTSDDEETLTSMKRIKPNSSKQPAKDTEMESVRNVLGSYMKDDAGNRKRQSSATKPVKLRFVEKPRASEKFYFFPRFW